MQSQYRLTNDCVTHTLSLKRVEGCCNKPSNLHHARQTDLRPVDIDNVYVTGIMTLLLLVLCTFFNNSVFSLLSAKFCVVAALQQQKQYNYHYYAVAFVITVNVDGGNYNISNICVAFNWWVSYHNRNHDKMSALSVISSIYSVISN